MPLARRNGKLLRKNGKLLRGCCCGCPCPITGIMCVLIYYDFEHWAKVDQLGENLCQFNEFFDTSKMGYEDSGLIWDTTNCQWVIEHLWGGTDIGYIDWEGRYVGPTTPGSPYGNYTLDSTVTGSPPSTIFVTECPCETDYTVTFAFADAMGSPETVTLSAPTSDPLAGYMATLTHSGRTYTIYMGPVFGSPGTWQLVFVDDATGSSVYFILSGGTDNCPPTGTFIYDGGLPGFFTAGPQMTVPTLSEAP